MNQPRIAGEERRKILDELAQAEMADGLYKMPDTHQDCSDQCADPSHEVCSSCGATRWEHSDEQWHYCHLSNEERKLYNTGIQGRPA